jgi:hypothetical protein
MSDVTAIRPGIKPDKPKRTRDPDGSLKRKIDDFQMRVGQASALARCLALSLDGIVLADDADGMDAANGLADLLDGIRADMVDVT